MFKTAFYWLLLLKELQLKILETMFNLKALKKLINLLVFVVMDVAFVPQRLDKQDTSALDAVQIQTIEATMLIFAKTVSRSILKVINKSSWHFKQMAIRKIIHFWEFCTMSKVIITFEKKFHDYEGFILTFLFS